MKQEVEVIMVFKVTDFNKTYMAYTTDDITDFKNIKVHFMQVDDYDTEQPKLTPVLDSEKSKVLDVYNELLKDKLTN